MWLLAGLLVASAATSGVRSASTAKYVVPEPLIEAFSPSGLHVSIPDSEGVELFAFHGSVNKPLVGLAAGDMSRDIVTRTRGRWVFEQPDLHLSPGDILYYWLYVQRYGLGYRKDSSYWIVDRLQSIPLHPDPPTSPHDAIASVMRTNCSLDNLSSELQQKVLLHLLEGHEFVLVVKNGQLQFKDHPPSGISGTG